MLPLEVWEAATKLLTLLLVSPHCSVQLLQVLHKELAHSIQGRVKP